MDTRRMNNREYWRYRALLLKAKSLDNAYQYENAMFKRLDSLERSIEHDLKQWYVRYANNNDIDIEEASKLLAGINTKNFDLTLAQFRAKAIKGGQEQLLNNEYFKSRIARLQDLRQQLQSEFQVQALLEEDRMQQALVTELNDSYMRQTYDLQQQKHQLDASFARYDSNQAQIVVSKPWGDDGLDFSERIWHNYRETLPSQLTDSLLRSTIKGDNYSKVVNDFRARYTEVKRKHVHRLVVTEMAHVTETATAKAYSEQGVEKYQYLATLESRTCDTCRKLDGLVFKMSERREGENYPVLHPWCRCTTVAYFEDLPSSDKRYDQENGELIDNMTYQQWLDDVA